MFYHKGSQHGCFGLKGLPLLHLTLLLLRDVLHKQGISSPICQTVVGGYSSIYNKVYQQCWNEWIVRCPQEGV